jgi:polyphosphate kinase 2 (PPK2 family)
MAATKRLNKAQKAENESASEGQEQLGGKEYERELARLHGELVKLQLWVVAKGANHRGAVGAFDGLIFDWVPVAPF